MGKLHVDLQWTMKGSVEIDDCGNPYEAYQQAKSLAEAMEGERVAGSTVIIGMTPYKEKVPMGVIARARQVAAERQRSLLTDGFAAGNTGFVEVVITREDLREGILTAERFFADGVVNEHTFSAGRYDPEEDRRRKISGLALEAAFVRLEKAQRMGLIRSVCELPNGQVAMVRNKARSVEPQPHYDGGIAAQYSNQYADIYVQTTTTYDMSKNENDPSGYRGWVCGWLPKDEWDQKKKFLPKGHVTSNGTKLPADQYVVVYSEMRPWTPGCIVQPIAVQ